ncbi:MAG: carboxypeptidase-like regulatory domain-containing protein [Planctomycetota bacterium]
MKHMRVFKAGAIALACLGMLIPASALEPAATAAVDSKQAPGVADVRLHDGGTLRGQLVNAQGRPLAQSLLSIRQADREIATAVSDQSGHFQVTGLRGGMYQIVAGEATGAYRLWAPRTAPPSAQPGVLVVVGGQQVLGQGNRILCLLRNPWVVAGIVAAAIAIPIAIHNADRHSD